MTMSPTQQTVYTTLDAGRCVVVAVAGDRPWHSLRVRHPLLPRPLWFQQTAWGWAWRAPRKSGVATAYVIEGEPAY